MRISSVVSVSRGPVASTSRPAAPQRTQRCVGASRASCAHAQRLVACRAQPEGDEEPKEKNRGSIQDQLLDYVTAGPKMRRWYGEGEFVPSDGGFDPDEEPGAPEEEEEEDIPKESILVMGADSEMGEQIVLQLILARAKVKVLVGSTDAAKNAYGDYVEPVSGDLRRALRGVKAVICPGKVGDLPAVAAAAGVEHLVLLSAAGISAPAGLSLGSLFGGESALLRDMAREEAVSDAGVPFTIVRAGQIKDVPGLSREFVFAQGDTLRGAISREDVAMVLVQAAAVPPTNGLVFEVANGNKGAPPSDWAAVLSGLQQF